jgi:hypothetical protein
MNPRQHPALTEARDFARNLAGDLRSFNKTLDNSPNSQLAVEDVANSLHSALQELIAGHAPAPEPPGRSLGDMVPAQPAAPPEAAAPPDEHSAAAALLAKLGA